MKTRAHLSSLALFVIATTAACRSTPSDSSRGQGAPPALDAGTSGQSATARGLEACVDAWLRENKLDPYGHPEGTMYAGGTPLFDERTGERKDRLAYVLERQPNARRACADGGG